jgi:thymidylate synthase (FAD)
MQNQILVELQETMGSDISIANAAWTSTYDKDKRENKYSDQDKIEQLVRRLILDKHGTPIESVIFRFWIRMPIFTDRQHMTHRIASHNGLSGRYRTMPHDYFKIPEDVENILIKAQCYNAAHKYNQICKDAYSSYKDSIEELKHSEKDGLISNEEFRRVREILRGQLPTSGMTERTTIMNLRSFANYQKQRNSIHAQPEIKLVAELMLKEVEQSNVCPIAINTLKEIGWNF